MGPWAHGPMGLDRSRIDPGSIHGPHPFFVAGESTASAAAATAAAAASSSPAAMQTKCK